jgi:hypothetical protein
LKLVLDVHHSRLAAQRLRALDVDVIAASDDSVWATAPDDRLLELAAAAGRAVVTENVKDFAPLAAMWAAQEREHAGIVFTSPKRFPRSSSSYPESLIQAIVTMAATAQTNGTWAIWLQ